jgi:photosystem II stability/assembly factor-like uncharacterized protein
MTGWAVGWNGTIINTTDGGEHWVTQTSGVLNDLNSVFFISATAGWAVGWLGAVINTTDGGDSWNRKISGTNCPLWSVFFTSETNGWIVGGCSEGLIFHTTNGGITWTVQTSSTYPSFSSVYFISSTTGWVAGGGTILKTTDGGENWIEQISGTDYGLNSVYFVTPTTGWAVGGASIYGFDLWGSIIHTTNGGDTWIEQSCITTHCLLSVYFTSLTTGWAVGGNGTILKTDGSATFVEEEKINEVPIDFLLSQNFPNPFNPGTKIKYSIPQTSQVQIKVFDVLGNEIETLVNEEKPAGTYEVEFSVGQDSRPDIASGVYFYQLKATPSSGQAGGYLDTKKMLLLK